MRNLFLFPHMDAFSVKEIVNIELFLFDILPLK